MEKVEKRIWDLPIRVTHWGLVVSFTGAYLTAEISPLIIHQTFAFACLTLVIFRLIWGVIGSETAQFSTFIKGYGAVKEYFLELVKFRHKEFWGHNPLGAIAVVTILGLMAILVLAGLFSHDHGFNGPWAQSVSPGISSLLQGFHEFLANLLLVVIIVHIVAILAYRVFFRDNLIKPMITGTRPADPDTTEVMFRSTWLAAIGFVTAIAITGAIFRFWIF